jgi:hypothetical protein
VQARTSVWIRSEEISDEDHIENDGQRNGRNFETPSDQTMALGRADHRVEYGTDKEAHAETTNVG